MKNYLRNLQGNKLNRGLLAFIACLLFSSNAVIGQSIPEYMYYKFDDLDGNQMLNYAPPATRLGDEFATVHGGTIGPDGQFGNAWISSGTTPNYIETGWTNDQLSGSWTISMWIDGITSSSSYIGFETNTANGNNWRIWTPNGGITMRTTGATGWSNPPAASYMPYPTGSAVLTWVYDHVTGDLTKYVDGVLHATHSMNPNITIEIGSFDLAAYSNTTTNRIEANGKIDEFRFYSRALDAAEIEATWNVPLGDCPEDIAVIDAADTFFVDAPSTIFNGFEGDFFGNAEWYVDGQFISDETDLSYTFTNTGFAEIMLIVDACDEVDTAYETVLVISPTEAPASEFIADKNTVSLFEEINFRELSTGGATNWAWTIRSADGSPADVTITQGDTASRNFTAFFNTPGIYNVCLTTTNAAGNNTICKEAYINVLAEYLMCLDVGLVSDTEGILHDDAGPGVAHGTNLNIPIGCDGGFGLDLCVAELRFELESFDLAPGAHLRIYEGIDNQGTPLWDERRYPDGLEGQLGDLAQTVFISNSGKMFFEFEADDNPDDNLGFTGIWSSTEADTFLPPTAAIEGPDSVCINSPAIFESASEGLGLIYDWSFSNQAATSNSRVFELRPENLGLQEITLFVENCGGVDSFTKEVVVVNPAAAPQPNFSVSQNRVQDDETAVDLIPEVEGCFESVEWHISPSTYEFVGGTDSLSDNPRVVFTEAGCYDIKLIAANNVGSSEVTQDCAVKFINYCTPNVADLNSDIGITRVQIGNMENISESGQEAYTDYTEISSGIEPIVLERGAQYHIEIERNTNLNNINRRVWIDFNANGVFDADELVVNQLSNSSLVHIDSFTVPMDAELAEVRLRIGVSFANQANRPCGVNPIGEFEDYPVVISNDITPPELTFTQDGPVNAIRCTPPSANQLRAFAFDNVDGDVTSGISISDFSNYLENEGTYELTYAVADAAGNLTEVTRTLNVLPDTSLPQISLNGSDRVVHDVLTVYTDSGATAMDDCSGLKELRVDNQVDESLIGDYQVIFEAEDSTGNIQSTFRTVEVRDRQAPELVYSEINEGDTIMVDVFETVDDFDIQFEDNYDNNVQITEAGEFFTRFANGRADTLGIFAATIVASDASGNEAHFDYFIRVVDRVAPEIDLFGLEYIEISRWDTFSRDSLVEVTDNFDETPQVSIFGSYMDDYLNNFLEGTYTINYQAIDFSGNRSVVASRVIRVRRNTTSTEDLAWVNDFSVFPNPAKDYFSVQLNLTESKQIDIRLVNSLGQTVQRIHDGELTGLEQDIDVSALSAGMYILQVTGDDVNLRKNIVIVK